VIQYVSGKVLFANSPPENIVAVDVGFGTSPFSPLSTFFGPLVGINVSLFNQSILVYIDGGLAPAVSIETDVAITFYNVTISGYLLDCSKSSCAAIAH
jgi:hypothetical protein